MPLVALCKTPLPVCFLGCFERLLAYGLFLLQVPGATTLLVAWLGAKLAASWQRFPVKNDEAGRKARAGTMVVLVGGVVSVTLGAVIRYLALLAIEVFV